MGTRWQEENPHERFRLQTPCPFCGTREVAFWFDPTMPGGDLDPFQVRCHACDARGPTGHAGEGDALFNWFAAVPAPLDVAVGRLRVERPDGFAPDGVAPEPPPSYAQLMDALRVCVAALGDGSEAAMTANDLLGRVPDEEVRGTSGREGART